MIETAVMEQFICVAVMEKKDGRCGFFHCKTPGLGCLVQIAEYRKQNEGGETLGINIKWHK